MKVNIYFSTLLCHTLNNCQQKVGIGGPNGRTSCPCAVPLDFFAVVNSRSVCVSFIIISLLFTNLEISANRRQRWPLVLRHTGDKKCDR